MSGSSVAVKNLPAVQGTPWAEIRDGRIIAEVGTTVKIPIDFFKPNPDNPRKYFDDDEIEATAMSYEARGDVEKAIDVTLRDDGRVALIIDGESRWRSGKLAKLEGISAYIKPPMTDDEVFVSSAVSNIRRRDFSIMEKALAIYDLQQRLNLDEVKAGEILGYKPNQTKYLLGFLDLIAEAQDLFMRNKLGAGMARQLLSYNAEDQDSILKKIKQEVRKNGGKAIHPNRLARILRLFAEKNGIELKKLAKGRDHESGAKLTAKHFMTSIKNLNGAIKEMKALNIRDLKEIKNPHIIDIHSALLETIKKAQELSEKFRFIA